MTLVERVAREIDPEAWSLFIIPLWPTRAARKRRALGKALAAIEAMREPTEAMCDAEPAGGFDIYWGYEADGRAWTPKDVWHAMIDVAMNESETGQEQAEERP